MKYKKACFLFSLPSFPPVTVEKERKMPLDTRNTAADDHNGRCNKSAHCSHPRQKNRHNSLTRRCLSRDSFFRPRALDAVTVNYPRPYVFIFPFGGWLEMRFSHP